MRAILLSLLGGGVGVGRGIWASLHQLPELAFNKVRRGEFIDPSE